MIGINLKENASTDVLKSKKCSTKPRRFTTQFAAPAWPDIEWPTLRPENAKNVPKLIVPPVPNQPINVPPVMLTTTSTVTHVLNKEYSPTVQLPPLKHKESASLVMPETSTSKMESVNPMTSSQTALLIPLQPTNAASVKTLIIEPDLKHVHFINSLQTIIV